MPHLHEGKGLEHAAVAFLDTRAHRLIGQSCGNAKQHNWVFWRKTISLEVFTKRLLMLLLHQEMSVSELRTGFVLS